MGELKQTLREDMKKAMIARDSETTSVLRMAMAAVSNAEVAGEAARELSDDEEKAVLRKEVASRKDSAEAYTSGGRPELAEKELREVAVLAKYLPAPLSASELENIVDDEVAKARAGGEELTPRHMGPLIKAVNDRAEGRAAGGDIAALVKAKILG